LHYANLTEYVAETEKDFGKRCHNWFHIANRLTRLHRLTRKRTFQQFCTDFKVDSVTNLELKVGTLNMPLRHIIMVLLGVRLE
jgi:hypothetical protein